MTNKNTSAPQTSAADQLRMDTMAQGDTAKKIRFLLSKGKSVKEIYHLLKDYGVTTKAGGEIRYQHVRNTAMMKLAK